MKTWFITVSFLLCFYAAKGQEILFSQPQKLLNKISHYKLLGKGQGELLVYKWGENFHLIESYSDANLKLNWARELDFPRKTKVLDIFPSEEYLTFVYIVKVKNEQFLYLKQVDYDFNTIGKEVLLDARKLGFGNLGYNYDVALSNDRSKIAVIMYDANKGFTKEIQYWVLDQSLKELFNRTVPLGESELFKQCDISNDARIAVLIAVNKTNLFGRTGQYEGVNLLEDEQEMTVPTTQFFEAESGGIVDALIEIDHINQQTILTGFYSEKPTNVLFGYFYATYPWQTAEGEHEISFHTFDKAFIQKVGTNKKVKDYLEYVQLKKVLVRSDGGALIIGERYFVKNRSYDHPMGPYLDLQLDLDMNQYTYGDVVIFSVNPSGELDWNTVLKKRQYSENDKGYYSSFIMLNVKRELHFLFNEEISKTTNVKDIRVNSKGDYDLESLFNVKDYNLSLALRYGKQVAYNEIIVPAFSDRNEFLLGKILF